MIATLPLCYDRYQICEGYTLGKLESRKIYNYLNKSSLKGL